MRAEIIAGIVVVTVLIVLLLFAVITERVTRSVATLRHVKTRYDAPVAAFTAQWDVIANWQPGSKERSDSPPVLSSEGQQGYTEQNDT